jgi:hypothetical protein
MIYPLFNPTLYIKTSIGYTPEGRREKNYLIATPKRNLLLRRKYPTRNKS